MSRDGALGWDAELPQIYGELRRLLRGGFVSLRRRPSRRGPARREYRITPEGRRELERWLSEPLEAPRLRDATLARLAFLERQPLEARIARLAAYRTLVVEALRVAGAPVSAARRRRRALLETELAWVDAERVLLLARIAGSSAPATPAEPLR